MSGETRLDQMREQVRHFHREHPEVLELFEKFAFEWIGSGRKRIGARAIWERLRWETAVNPAYRTGKQFKLNNNFHPFYARAFEKRHPEFAGIFEKRRQRSVGHPAGRDARHGALDGQPGDSAGHRRAD